MKKPWIEKLFFMVSGVFMRVFKFMPHKKNHEFSVNGWILMVHEKWNGFWWHFHYPWIIPLAYFSWERQRHGEIHHWGFVGWLIWSYIHVATTLTLNKSQPFFESVLNPNYYSQGLFKKNLQSAQSAVCILTWLHFSMVYYSVNKAINHKKSIIAIQNSSGIHVNTSSTVSPFQAAIMTFQIWPLKMNNKFQRFHPI